MFHRVYNARHHDTTNPSIALRKCCSPRCFHFEVVAFVWVSLEHSRSQVLLSYLAVPRRDQDVDRIYLRRNSPITVRAKDHMVGTSRVKMSNRSVATIARHDQKLCHPRHVMSETLTWCNGTAEVKRFKGRIRCLQQRFHTEK